MADSATFTESPYPLPTGDSTTPLGELVGVVLGGRYRVDSFLGSGGQGEVYKGTQLALNRAVAIKVLPPFRAQDPAMRARFEREAQRLAQLRQANIVDIIDYGSEGGRYYIVSEFVDGPSLRDLLDRNPGHPMPPEQVLEIARQIGQALDYAHNQRPAIIHRDIKPSNILLDQQGRRAVLCDFALARRVEDESLDVSGAWGQVLGTPAYMSPEQCLDEPLDARSDIYSLGVVLYEMFTGRHPFRGEHDTSSTLRRKHIRQPPSSPRKLNPALKPGVEKVLLKALAKDPAERFQSVGEFIEALERASRAPAIPLIRPAAAMALGGVALVVAVGLILTQNKGLKNVLFPKHTPEAITVTVHPPGSSLASGVTTASSLPTYTLRFMPRPSATSTLVTDSQRVSTMTPLGAAQAPTEPPTVTPISSPEATSTPVPPFSSTPRPTVTAKPSATVKVQEETLVTVTGLDESKLSCITLVFLRDRREVGRIPLSSQAVIKGPACDEVKVEGDVTGTCPWSTHTIANNPVKVVGGQVKVAFTPVRSGGGKQPPYPYPQPLPTLSP